MKLGLFTSVVWPGPDPLEEVGVCLQLQVPDKPHLPSSDAQRRRSSSTARDCQSRRQLQTSQSPETFPLTLVRAPKPEAFCPCGAGGSNLWPPGLPASHWKLQGMAGGHGLPQHLGPLHIAVGGRRASEGCRSPCHPLATLPITVAVAPALWLLALSP